MGGGAPGRGAWGDGVGAGSALVGPRQGQNPGNRRSPDWMLEYAPGRDSGRHPQKGGLWKGTLIAWLFFF